MARTGRPSDKRKVYYALKFDLHTVKLWRTLNTRLLDQLDHCRSDVERRLILGKSR